MSNWQQRYKPAAPAWAHLMLSALLWTAVGTGLALAGVCWVSRLPRVWAIVLIGGAALVGWFKAQVVLRRAAQRIAARIVARGDGRCLGGFLSWRTWLLVLAMITAGPTAAQQPRAAGRGGHALRGGRHRAAARLALALARLAAGSTDNVTGWPSAEDPVGRALPAECRSTGTGCSVQQTPVCRAAGRAWPADGCG